MTILQRLLLTLGLALGWSALGLAGPRCAYACTCAPAAPLAAYAGNARVVVLTGSVSDLDSNHDGTFTVERWYSGPNPVKTLHIRGGDRNTCGVTLEEGAPVIIAANLTGQVLTPTSCTAYAILATDAGKALQGEAILAFGTGTVPVGSSESSPEASPEASPTPPQPASGIPWFVPIGAILASVAISSILVAFFARRRTRR